MRDNYVYFAGKNLSDFNTFATNAGVYSAPARSYESFNVAGRNGSLIKENDTFSNVEHKYPLVIMSDFDTNFEALKSFLLSQKGYKRLSDTFYPDIFYLATFKGFDDVKQDKYTTDKNTMGTCVLVFDRKPQRFIKNGEKTIRFTDSGSLKNFTQFDALPLLRVYGSGTLTVNDVAITKDITSEYLDIDCELQEVLQAGGNLEITLVNGEFPKLKSGLNTITLGGGITKVDIIPRWWKL